MEHGVSEDRILLIDCGNYLYAKHRNTFEFGKYARDYCKGKADCIMPGWSLFFLMKVSWLKALYTTS